MDKTKLKLASVKLINNGMKGIEVEYLLPSVKQNVQFLDTYKAKRKAPIHDELVECFKWLPNYLLDICGYTLEKEEREFLVNATTVTSVKYGDKGIILSGTLAVLGGNKDLTLTTPLIVDETDYPDFGKLVSIINGIYTETAEYMAGKKVMSDAQIVARFNSKNDEFDHESFKKMTPAEQRDIATKILEEQGHLVFHNDEITSEEESEVIDSTAPAEFKAPEWVGKAKDETPEETLEEPALHVVYEVQETEPMVTADIEDDFMLPLVKQPVKEPVKRKVKTA